MSRILVKASVKKRQEISRTQDGQVLFENLPKPSTDSDNVFEEAIHSIEDEDTKQRLRAARSLRSIRRKPLLQNKSETRWAESLKYGQMFV